jgi:hypothetical protein
MNCLASRVSKNLDKSRDDERNPPKLTDTELTAVCNVFNAQCTEPTKQTRFKTACQGLELTRLALARAKGDAAAASASSTSSRSSSSSAAGAAAPGATAPTYSHISTEGLDSETIKNLTIVVNRLKIYKQAPEGTSLIKDTPLDNWQIFARSVTQLLHSQGFKREHLEEELVALAKMPAQAAAGGGVPTRRLPPQ